MKKEYKLSWLAMVYIFLATMVCSVIGMALPPSIAMINYGNLAYGTWASYFCSILLFYVLVKDTRIMIEKK